MEDGLDGVRGLLPGVRMEVADLLGGSRRSRVRRIRAGWRTLVVKEYNGTGEGWVRECAALSVLPCQVRAPRLIVAGAEPPTLVMSDVGPGRALPTRCSGPTPPRTA